MPRLWNQTIETHRREVRDAILDTTAALVADHGLLSVTMSQIAERTGIGRATLYKYFPDVRAILLAWHERQVGAHIDHLVAVRDRAGSAAERLRAVLDAYALISYGPHGPHGNHDGELTAFLHREEQISQAQQRLHGMVRDLVAAGAAAGDLRGDVGPDELTTFCLHAVSAAGSLPSEAAAQRLVGVVLDALRPRPRPRP